MLARPIELAFTSTKLPMWTSSASSVPGRMRAYGPMRALAPMRASSISENGFTSVPAPSVTSRRMQFAPTRTPSPSTTSPSKMQLTSIITSRPHWSVPRTSMRAGSAIETPASSSRAAWFIW